MLGGNDAELVHRELLSPNYGERTLPVSMVVLHYTEMKPVEAALERMCDAQASVSAHYCITEEGEVIRLVPEDKRAWHAGASYWLTRAMRARTAVIAALPKRRSTR